MKFKKTSVIVIGTLSVFCLCIFANAQITNKMLPSTNVRVQTTVTPTTATTEDNVTLCLRDTNKDEKIGIASSEEFYPSLASECELNGGASGDALIFAQETKRGWSVFFSEVKNKMIAAVFYLFGGKQSTSETTNPVNDSRTSLEDTSNTDTTNKSNLIGVVKAGLGYLDPQALRDIGKDRVKAGLDKKKWDMQKYNCADFSRDLEKTNPEKYTFTSVKCTIKASCTGTNGKKIKGTFIVGHAINDVHLSGGTLGYVEPRTAKEVDMDSNGDGKVDKTDSSLIAQQDGIASAVADLANENKNICSDDFVIESTKCDVLNFEDAKSAFSKLGPASFRPNFNPN